MSNQAHLEVGEKGRTLRAEAIHSIPETRVVLSDLCTRVWTESSFGRTMMQQHTVCGGRLLPRGASIHREQQQRLRVEDAVRRTMGAGGDYLSTIQDAAAAAALKRRKERRSREK